jgi:hypothetical protein
VLDNCWKLFAKLFEAKVMRSLPTGKLQEEKITFNKNLIKASKTNLIHKPPESIIIII